MVVRLIVVVLIFASSASWARTSVLYDRYLAEKNAEIISVVQETMGDVRALVLINQTYLSENQRCLTALSAESEVAKLSNLVFPEDPICNKLVVNLRDAITDDLIVYRRYLAIALLQTVFIESAGDESAFSDVVLTSLIDRRLPSPHFQSALPGPAIAYHPLDESEMRTALKVLKNFIRDSCFTEFEKSFANDPLKIKTENASPDSLAILVCTNIDKRDFGFAQLQGPTWLGSEMTRLFAFRRTFKRWLLDEGFPSLRKTAMGLYSHVLHRHSLVLLIEGLRPEARQLRSAFSTLQTANGSTLNRLTNLETTLNGSASFEEKIKAARFLFEFDFVIQNKLTFYGSQPTAKRRFAILKHLYDSTKIASKDRQDLATLAQLGATAACFFMPNIRLFLAVTPRNLCMAVSLQGWTATLAILNYQRLAEIYRLFLSLPDGQARLVSVNTLNDTVRLQWLSLLVLPLGTTESLRLMKSALPARAPVPAGVPGPVSGR